MKFLALTISILWTFISYGQEVKWKNGEIVYDMTYEVAKKSFIIKKLNDFEYTVQVNKLGDYEPYPYSQDFLFDSVGKPNGKLIVTEKYGKQFAELNYLNGKLIGLCTFYYKKNKISGKQFYDSFQICQWDSVWFTNGKIGLIANKEKGFYYSYYLNGKLNCSSEIDYARGIRIIKHYDKKGKVFREEERKDVEKYWP